MNKYLPTPAAAQAEGFTQRASLRTLQGALADKDPGNTTFPPISADHRGTGSTLLLSARFENASPVTHHLQQVCFLCLFRLCAGSVPGLCPATQAVLPSQISSVQPCSPHHTTTGAADEYCYKYRQLSLLTKMHVQHANYSHVNGIPTLDTN